MSFNRSVRFSDNGFSSSNSSDSSVETSSVGDLPVLARKPVIFPVSDAGLSRDRVFSSVRMRGCFRGCLRGERMTDWCLGEVGFSGSLGVKPGELEQWPSESEIECLGELVTELATRLTTDGARESTGSIIPGPSWGEPAAPP